MKKVGKFIVFEGVDRCGKTTQSTMLSKHLGENVKLMRFPNRETPIGKLLDSLLKGKTVLDDHASHLLFSANRWEVAKEIKETLANGTWIVCDRYYYSGVAYSAAKGLDHHWCLHMDVDLPVPDLVLYLDIPIGTLKTRSGYGEEINDDDDFLRAVDGRFKTLFVDMPKWEVIDGRGGVDDVFLRVINAIGEIK